MALGNEYVTISLRHFSVPIGSYDWTDKSGINDIKRRITVYVNYEETVTEHRGLRSASAAGSTIVPRTYRSTHGSSILGDYVEMFFDYDYSRVTHSCRRVSEAGFYTDTETSVTALGVIEQISTT